MQRFPTIVIAALSLAGCASSLEASFTGGESATSATDTALDSDASPPAETGTGALDQVPEWWSIAGSLTLAGGDIDPVESSLQIFLWSSDIALLCTLDLPINGTGDLAPPASEPAIYSWWSVDHADGESATGCGTWDAGTLAVGLGAYDSRLDPALDGHDLLGADVYGLYLQLGIEEPVYVVGIAGTADLLAGTAAISTAPPLPDDLYQLESLVVLAL